MRRKKKIPRKSASRWTSLAGVFGVVFLVALAARAPATLATAAVGLDRAGVGYEGIEGTVWNGALKGVSVDGVRLGDVAFRASPAALLRGGLEFDVESRNGALDGAGRFSADLGGGVRARAVSATVDLAAFHSLRALGQPLRGRARVAIETLALSQRGCLSARGSVKTDAAVAAAEAFGRKGFDMEGPLSCRDGDAVLRLEGAGDGLEAVTEIRLRPGFKLAAAASLKGSDPGVSLALENLGFRYENGAWRTETGGLSVGGSR